MKGIIVHYLSGQMFDKIDAYTLFNCLRFSRETFSEIDMTAMDDYYIVTSEQDAFGRGSQGCLSLKNGSWTYLNPADLEEIRNVTINI